MNAEDARLYNDASRLVDELWRASPREGLFTDPRIVSVILFKRLRSHYRGYAVLTNAGLLLEADIILRAAVEVAICISANAKLKEAFVLLLRQDAAHSLLGQIKQHRDSEDSELVREGEALLRTLQATLPEGVKPAKLNWSSLAVAGQVGRLYGWHKMLSSVSSHVTGHSVLKGIVTDDAVETQDEWADLTKTFHPLMMIGTALQGGFLHGIMIENEGLAEASLVLARRLDARLAELGYDD